MAQERIDIIISERGARTVQKSIKDVGKAAEVSAGAVELLKTALEFAGIALTIEALIHFGDQALEISNILKGATESTDEFKIALAGVQDIGITTGTSIKSLAELYDTLATAGKDFGITQAQNLQITETIAKAFAAEGKSAEEAGGAINALARSLLKGTADARGIISILNSSNLLAETLAKQFHLTVGQMVQDIQDGKIASQDIFKALLQSRNDIQKSWEGSSTTLTQAFTSLQGALIKMAGAFESSTHFVSGLAAAIQFLANHMDALVVIVAPFVGILLAKMISGISTLIGLTKQLQAAVVYLNIAMDTNPIGLIVIAIAALVAGVILAYKYINVFREAVDRTLVSLGFMTQATADAHIAAAKLAEKEAKAAEAQNKLAETGHGAATAIEKVGRDAYGAAIAVDSYGHAIEQVAVKHLSMIDQMKASVEALGGSWSDVSGPSAKAADAAVHFGDSISNVNVGLNQGVQNLGSYRSALDDVADGYHQVALAINEVNFANGAIGGGKTRATSGGGAFGSFSAFSLESLRKDLEAGTLNSKSPLFDNIYGPLGGIYSQNFAELMRQVAAEKAAKSAELLSGQSTTSPTVSPQSVDNSIRVQVPVNIITPNPQAFGQSQAQIQRSMAAAINRALDQR